jgi:hypothetical protein
MKFRNRNLNHTEGSLPTEHEEECRQDDIQHSSKASHVYATCYLTLSYMRVATSTPWMQQYM